MAITWLPTKPVQSGYLQSAKIRENIQAIAAQNLGVNLLGDPTFICWPKSDGGLNAQGYWVPSGAGGTLTRETGAGNFKYDGMSAKLVYGSANLYHIQYVLTSNADIAPFIGRYVSAGVWMKGGSAAAGLLVGDGGAGGAALSFHSGGGDWEWLTVTFKIKSDAIYLIFGIILAASATVYVDGATMVRGPIPPPDYVPCPTRIVTTHHILTGDPIAVNVKQWVNRTKPYIVRSVYLSTMTGLVTGSLVVDLDHYDGAAWQSMFSTRPTISTVGATREYAKPDGTYRYRCFLAGGDINSGAQDDGHCQTIVDTAPSSGCANPHVMVNTLEWDRPLDGHNNFNDP